MITIKVLGAGCQNCKRVEAIVRHVVGKLGVPADVVKVTDYNAITNYDLLATPGLVINEQVVSAGRIPSEAEVTRWVAAAANA
jgi:small redox-active disulfide protein 2